MPYVNNITMNGAANVHPTQTPLELQGTFWKKPGGWVVYQLCQVYAGQFALLSLKDGHRWANPDSNWEKIFAATLFERVTGEIVIKTTDKCY